MPNGFLPDVVDEFPSKVACPECHRLTYYALNTDRYVCPAHGPVVTAEVLPRLATGGPDDS